MYQEEEKLEKIETNNIITRIENYSAAEGNQNIFKKIINPNEAEYSSLIKPLRNGELDLFNHKSFYCKSELTPSEILRKEVKYFFLIN